MYYVYILKSTVRPNKIYIGFTENLDKRIKSHNSKKSLFSRKNAPWEIVSYTVFFDRSKALSFEKYLKKGSGFAFFKKHLI